MLTFSYTFMYLTYFVTFLFVGSFFFAQMKTGIHGWMFHYLYFWILYKIS